MNEEQALDGFAALSQPTRLRIVRMLVTAGANGLAAGAIASALDGSAESRVSFHLSHLEKAGLVVSRGKADPSSTVRSSRPSRTSSPS